MNIYGRSSDKDKLAVDKFFAFTYRDLNIDCVMCNVHWKMAPSAFR